MEDQKKGTRMISNGNSKSCNMTGDASSEREAPMWGHWLDKMQDRND